MRSLLARGITLATGALYTGVWFGVSSVGAAFGTLTAISLIQPLRYRSPPTSRSANLSPSGRLSIALTLPLLPPPSVFDNVLQYEPLLEESFGCSQMTLTLLQ